MGYLKETDFLREVEKHKKICIYGAGMVGSLVLLRLRSFGIEDDRICFIVSKASDNQTYFDMPVYSVGEYEWGEDFKVIVATLPKNQGQIISNLKKNNIKEYIAVDDELFEEMERGYISDFNRDNREVSINDDIDVLYMSSDNNYTSGAFLCMVDLCKGMREAGLKTLVVLPGYGNGEKLLQENKIDYLFVQSRGGLVEPGKEFSERERIINETAVSEIEKIIRTYHVKLVHNNTNHTYVGPYVARKMGIPYIWHSRENINEQGFLFFNDDFIYEIINGANRIITVSRYIGDCYPKLDKTRVSCVYDGVDTKKYYCEREILKNKTIQILMPGIMIPLKGQLQLIKAAKTLNDLGVDFDISLVGSGDADYIREIEDEVKNGNIEKRVHLYERVNNLEEWYRDADIVVVCSRSEAFGRVTVEAQLSGCIVVGADCGATPELICDGESGYLYELNNIEMLKNKLLEIYNNREKASIVAKSGQKKAKELYDKEINSKRICEIYKMILGEQV